MTAHGTPVSRLAPSPTGALHLGNARTFLINWAMARQNNWQLRLRIDDLVGPRLKPETAQLVIDQLIWLGLDWDGQPLYQSQTLEPYQQALQTLRDKNLIYPCQCTRKEIALAQSAPHQDEHELRYPGTCRPANPAARLAQHHRPQALLHDDMTTAWRVIVPDQHVTFHDVIQGPQSFNVQQQVGDFIVATKNGQPAYQLAVVVDDQRQSVTEIVRGDDLLRSTARQLLLYHMLSTDPAPAASPDTKPPSQSGPSEISQIAIPTYYHLPLVLGADGRRLAKRHGDTRLLHYQQHGVPPEAIIGLLAFWSGITDRRQPMTTAQFAQRFDPGRLPAEPATFTSQDEAYLQTASKP